MHIGIGAVIVIIILLIIFLQRRKVMVESAAFIGAVIIALTQVVKYLAPNVNGAVTILIAALVGVVVGLVDGLIGVTDVTVAQGVMIALAAVGTVTTVQSFGSKAPPKNV